LGVLMLATLSFMEIVELLNGAWSGTAPAVRI